jgi:IS5 family transposase
LIVTKQLILKEITLRSTSRMRQARQKQLNVTPEWLPMEHARELQAMGRVLDQNPAIAELVWQDLKAERVVNDDGAEGLSAEQILRTLIIKQLNGFSYRALAFHLVDSTSYRTFCGFGLGQRPSKTVLAACIKTIRHETIEQINRILVGVAGSKKIEDGTRVRVDTTVVESNIHTARFESAVGLRAGADTSDGEGARDSWDESELSEPNATCEAAGSGNSECTFQREAEAVISRLGARRERDNRISPTRDCDNRTSSRKRFVESVRSSRRGCGTQGVGRLCRAVATRHQSNRAPRVQ